VPAGTHAFALSTGLQFWLFTVYDKDEMSDLTPLQRKALKEITKRNLTHGENGEEISQSLPASTNHAYLPNYVSFSAVVLTCLETYQPLTLAYGTAEELPHYPLRVSLRDQ
jgi:hypothetical protein